MTLLDYSYFYESIRHCATEDPKFSAKQDEDSSAAVLIHPERLHIWTLKSQQEIAINCPK